MSAGKIFSSLLAVLLVLLVGWSIFDAVGRLAVDPPLAHLRFAAYFRATLLAMFEHFSFIVVLSAILTFSLFLSPSHLGSAGTRLIAVARPVLYVVLTAGILNGLWFSLLAPRAELRMQQIVHQSRTARDSLVEARDLLDRQDWDNAETQLLLYQAIVGETEEVADLLRRARAGQLEVEQRLRADRSGIETGAIQWVSEAASMSVAELVTRARDYLRERDYFSAHHYATLAVEQSRTPRQDARSIQAEALNAIERGSLAQDEAEARQIYRDKVAAYEAFRRGETIPEQALEAFYRFQDLERIIPDDPDVRRFAPEARRRAEEISFFIEDARTNQALPGRNNLVFINRRTAGGVELVAVDHLVRVPAGDFFYGVEIIRTVTNESLLEVELHVQAPYGKAIGDRLIMRAVPREREDLAGPAGLRGPVFLAGSPDRLNGSLVLHRPVDEFARYAGGPDAIATLTLPELIEITPVVTRLGRTPRDFYAEMIRRLFRLGGFFVVSLVAIALGWKFRSQYVGRPSIGVLLLVPLMVWVAWWTLGTARQFVEAAAEFLVATMPLAAATTVASASLVFVIILAVHAVVRQTIEI